MPEKRLMRDTDHKMIAGVCAGIANYFELDPTLVRVVYALLMLLTAFFPLLILYIVMVFVIPEAASATPASEAS